MTLLLDTSTNIIYLGLIKGFKLIAEHSFESNFRHSEELLPIIDKFLKKNGVELRDMSGIAVVSGPGSFTGLRIGIAVANTLSFVLGIPIVGVKSAELQFLNSKVLIKKLKKVKLGKFIIPFYGQKPKITLKRK